MINPHGGSIAEAGIRWWPGTQGGQGVQGGTMAGGYQGGVLGLVLGLS